jgi:hypothetical protein
VWEGDSLSEEGFGDYFVLALDVVKGFLCESFCLMWKKEKSDT